MTTAAARRREDLRLVTGSARFTADIGRPGMLHAAFTRSPVAHAAMTGLDLGDARRLPGVAAAFDAAGLGCPDQPAPQGLGPGAAAAARPVLASSRVRFVGEAMALVVAASPTQAREAAALVDVDFEELPVVATPEQALGGVPSLFPDIGSNVLLRRRDGNGPLPDGPVVVSLDVPSQRLEPLTLETLGIVAEPDGSGGLTIWCGCQAPHLLRRALAPLVGVDESRIRVIVPDVGGGFGLKGGVYPEYAAVARAALLLDRPVRWLASRSEQFVAGAHGRSQRHEIRIVGDAAGQMTGVGIRLLADLGAYPQRGWFVPLSTVQMASGPYRFDAVDVDAALVVTNRVPTGPYRGAGRPEAAYALERAVDAFARRIGRDPAEVRLANFIGPDELPLVTSTGARYDSGDYAAALERALRLAGVDAVRAEQERQPPGTRIGLGIASFVERAGGGDPILGEYARVALDGDGVTVATGSVSTGQSHETVWAELVAAVFAVPPERVRVVAGDTDLVADGIGTFGSRSAQAGASAAWKMAVEVKDVATRLAADLLEAAPADLVLEGGEFRVLGVPGAAVTLAEVVNAAGGELVAAGNYVPDSQAYPYGTHIAVVRVDVETGEVILLRYVAVDDCGRVLDAGVVDGQVHGSVAQGIGQALLEAVDYDPTSAQPLAGSLLGYAVPHACSVPPIHTDRLETPAPGNILGVKGIGEAGCIGAPAAVVNAVVDALAEFGVEHIDTPLRPERVWRALRRSGASG